MKNIQIAVTAILISLLSTHALAYELYDKSSNRSFGVKLCEPATGEADDKVTFISCTSANDEKIAASKGSICSNYQSDGCGPLPDSAPAMTSTKIKPWNYFDNSTPDQTVTRPASIPARAAAAQNVDANSTKKGKTKYRHVEEPADK